MASNQTEHYGLNQWTGEDQFIRAEFNEDNLRVDTVLAGKAEQNDLIALSSTVEARGRTFVATYVGDGTAKRHISVGFPIKAVLVERPEGYRTSDSGYVGSGMAVSGKALGSINYPIVSVSGDGFDIYHWDSYIGTANAKGYTYYYVAFG